MSDDNELLRQCQQGNQSALDVLLRRYEERIYRLAYRVLGDATLAQDATALALVKVWTRAKQWRGEASASTWIYRMAYRTIVDTGRGEQRWWKRWFAPVSPDVPDEKPAPDEIAADREGKDTAEKRIQEALTHLSEDDRTLVHLYYFEERSLKEIEEIMGVARAALKMRLSRARQRLRGLLEEYGESF